MEENTPCAIVDFRDHVRQGILEISPNLELSRVSLKKGKGWHEVMAFETTIGEASRIYQFAIEQGKTYDFKVAISAETQTGRYEIIADVRWKQSAKHRKSLQQTVTEGIKKITGETPRKLHKGRLGTIH